MAGYPQTSHTCSKERLVDAAAHATIKAAPEKAATSIRDLTTSALEPAMTREVSMATTDRIRNHTHSDSVLALPPGEWVLKAGVWKFQAIRNQGGRPQDRDRYDWDEPSRLEAHRMFAQGHDDAKTREGERVYQREVKRAQRARRLERVAA